MTERESEGMPRWVKVVGIAVAVLALMVVVMLMIGGGGGHGPSRHGSIGGDTGAVSVGGVSAAALLAAGHG